MGGTVRVAVRFKSGEIVCLDRWTNAMPDWIINARMFEGDEAYLREFLAAPSDKTPQPVAPFSYGLIVLDFQTNHLLTMQNYTSFDCRDPVHLLNRHDDADADDIDCWNILVANGRLGEFARPSIETRALPDWVVDYETLTRRANELYRLSDLDRGDPLRAHWVFSVDTRPLQYIAYGNGRDGITPTMCLSFQARLVELGFVLSADDLAAWNSFIADVEAAQSEDDANG